MYFANVEIDEIDLEDKKYQISKHSEYEQLEQSISEFGLINPVKLIKTEKLFKVLTGWSRLSVLKKLKFKIVEASVYDEKELTEEMLYKIIYLDNKHRGNDLYKAELINRIRENCGLENEQIVNNLLPFFGLNPSTNNYNKYIKIALLDSDIKQSYNNEHLTFEQLQMLGEINDNGLRADIFRLFLTKYKFNNNETRDLLKDLFNIKNKENISIKMISEAVYNKLDDNSNKNDFRKELKKICYPALTKVEKVYSDRIKDLNLSNKIRVVNHPYFESNELEIRIKFKETDELRDELNDLDKNIINGNIEKLLGVIKEGK
ncbi:MAG: ParB/RepB/Spo0J family partition protein [Thermodesulfobacteriota bacterium]